VDLSLPRPAIGFVNATASIFAPALIKGVDLPVRARMDGQALFSKTALQFVITSRERFDEKKR
jgi:hypothetical protein